MKKYLSYFKLYFIKELQYRAAALAGLSTQFFFGFVFVSVYVAFYESGGKDLPITLEQTVNYIWLGQAFFAMINQFYQDAELMELVRSGGISYELTRPQDIYFMWYAKLVGSRMSKAVLRCLPVLIVGFLLPAPLGLTLPASPYAFIMFFLTLIIGGFLSTAVVILYPIITTRTISEKGIIPIMVTLADLLSGGIVPTPLLPKIIRSVAQVLPFQYVSDIPFRIYSGNILASESLTIIGIQIIWIILLVIIGSFILKQSLKRVVVQGG